MEDNNYRGNSYSDNDSRENNGGRPRRKRIIKSSSSTFGSTSSEYRPRTFESDNSGYHKPYNRDGQKRSFNRSNNFGGNKPYGNRRNNEDRPYGGYNNNGYNNYGENREYGNRDYNNREYGKREYNNRDYNNDRSENRYNSGNYNGGQYNNRRGSRYTVDEKGYHHKKYWDHSDRRQKAIEHDAQSEDDTMLHDGKIRLNKFLSNSGLCSRREADKMIKQGLVSVNGEVVTEMGVKVNLTDQVMFSGHLVKPERKRYIILNKPKDYITTLRDPHARNTVMELIEGACKERVYPVGRLDRNTTGVLLFTNDGDLAKKLTHPSNEIQKVYHVTLDRNVARADMDKVSEGFDLEDGFIRADEIIYPNADVKSEVQIRIHSGRNRIVRRIFEALGYEVKKLDRVFFAGLSKKGIPRGQWRFLNDREIGYLNMISNNSETPTDDVVDDSED